MRPTGATPAPSLRLLVGLCATPALAFFSARISPSSTCTQCAARTFASKRPCFLTQGTTGMPLSAPRVVHLQRRLRQMDVERHVELDGELRARAQDLRRAGVGRVRRRRRDDQRMAVPPLDEVARAGQRVLVARRVGRREAQHRLRAERAHAGRGRGFGDRLLEVVHVGEAGHAGPDHLGAAEPRAEPDEVGADERPLDRHHVAHQPDVEPQIVGEAAQQRHRRRACAR